MNSSEGGLFCGLETAGWLEVYWREGQGELGVICRLDTSGCVEVHSKDGQV
jgi:hypothetical protein